MRIGPTPREYFYFRKHRPRHGITMKGALGHAHPLVAKLEVVIHDHLGDAIRLTGENVSRAPGREVQNGPHEDREFGPALKEALSKVFADSGSSGWRAELRQRLDISNFTRLSTVVDLVVFGPTADQVAYVAELKCWDVGHQLFDLAKVCCLLSTGIPAGFLVCAARRPADFDRQPGGELFPPREGETRPHRFLDLITRHEAEWRRHVGRNGPEPTSVPAAITTTALAAGVEISAYPGHEIRAIEVRVSDASPVQLTDGIPA